MFNAFGNSQQAQAGQTTTANGGAFSGFGLQNQNQNQNQATQSTNVPSTNPLFGGGAFGQKASSTGSLFGGSATNTNQTAENTGTTGGLFGGTGGANAFGNTGGNTQNTNAFGAPLGGSLFGANNAASQPASGSNLFGAQNQQANTQSNTTAPQSSLFGSSNLFGQNNQQTQTQPSTSLFGQQQPAQAQPPAYGSFGQSLNPQQATASSSNQPLGSSLLGVSSLGASSSLFAPKASTTGLLSSQNQQQDTAQGQFTNLVQRIEGIEQAWNSGSPNCRFQHFFYNLVDPNTVNQYGRPPNATNDAAWQKAVRENPDSTCYVPALAIGFDDLQKRVEAQRSQSTAHQEKLKELKTRITNLTESHANTNAPRLKRAVALQGQLNQRLVRLVQHLHLLIPAIRSSSIRPEEEALRSVLESLEEEIRRPSGVGRLKGKLSEFWAILGSIEAARERERNHTKNGVEWAVVDQEGLRRLTQVLVEQQTGITHLTKIVQGHQKDLDVILGKTTQEREADAFSHLQSSQALFGASVR